jgi:hypothetical protein
MKRTKKELLAELGAAARVEATIVGPMITLNEWPDQEKLLIADGFVKNQFGCYVDPRNTLRFVLKPRLPRVRTGLMHLTSRRYKFVWSDANTSGDISDLRIVDSGCLTLALGNRSLIEYRAICEK